MNCAASSLTAVWTGLRGSALELWIIN